MSVFGSHQSSAADKWLVSCAVGLECGMGEQVPSALVSHKR